MSMDGFNGRGDEPTGRTRLVQEFDIFRDGAEKHAKRSKMWMQILGGLCLSGFLAGLAVPSYIMKVAHTAEQTAMQTRLTVVETKLDLLLSQLGIRPRLPVPPLQIEKDSH